MPENNIQYNTKIDRSRISIIDPESSYTYLRNEANVDPDIANRIYTDLKRQKAINQDKLDQYNSVISNASDEERTAIKLKGLIDNNSDIEFADDDIKESKLTKDYVSAVNGMYGKDNAIAYRTSNDNLFKDLTNFLGGRSTAEDLGFRFETDKNGRNVVILDKENSRYTKYFIDAVDKTRANHKWKNFWKSSFGHYDGSRIKDAVDYTYLPGSPAVGTTHSYEDLISDAYRRISNAVSKTSAKERTDLVPLNKYAGENPWITDLIAMRNATVDKKERDNLDNLINANRETYRQLFESNTDFSNINLKLLREDNTFTDATSAEKVELSSKFAKYMADKSKPLNINATYNSVTGKMTPQVTFTDADGKTISFMGDFIRQDSYDEYNQSADFRAISDVAKLGVYGGNLTVGFSTSLGNGNSAANLQLSRNPDDTYSLMVGGERINVGRCSKSSASTLRKNYNSLIATADAVSRGRISKDDVIKNLPDFIREFKNDFNIAFPDLKMSDTQATHYVTEILNLQ